MRGVIVTARSTEYDFVSRFFAPEVGIFEDPVNGSAHCCLGVYWKKKLGKSKFYVYQASKRGGILKVEVKNERVLISGKAVTVVEGNLFIEMPYYTAELLNRWMQSDSNDILDSVYDNWAGTASHDPNVKEFYENIKSQCPETIFHGTDVGHQYDTTGEQFIEYPESNNLEGSEQYQLTEEPIKQGKRYYRRNNDVYRENMMVENFIREFDKLDGERIMDIYGSAHTELEAMDYSNSVECMANQLKEHYGDIIQSEDLSRLLKDVEPYRVDIIQINGKDYEASYFGKQDMTGFSKDYKCRKFWRLENAYDDFKDKDKTKTKDFLPYNNYPMLIESGQVFVIDYTKTDDSVIRKYYRSDGHVWRDLPSTEEFKVE